VYAGHIGFALAGKGIRADAPLWLLVFATQGCDWIEAVACLRNPETSAMWSHSIPAVLALAGVVGIAAYLFTRKRGIAVVASAVAVSHVAADYVTGLKPTWPGGPIIGLDLYSHPVGDFLIEAVVITLGWLVYRQSLPLASRSRWLTRALVVLLVGGQLAGVLKHLFFPLAPKCA
jgi:hypothetical protein